MEVYYQGKNITGFVQIRSCIVRDTCGGRCDSLEMEFENAGMWYGWGPQEDDQIRVMRGGYDSGTMYLNSVLPADGKFRVYATALPCAARRKESRSFYRKSIEQIVRACAAAAGFSFSLFGVDGGTVIEYIQQENESAPSFLHRLLRYEGAKLKCINGRFAAIGVNWAQEQPEVMTISITSGQRGAEYKRSGSAKKSITIQSLYGSAKAVDDGAGGNRNEIRTAPVRNDFQAGRWARGLLLDENRECEEVILQTDFQQTLTAMVRVDVTGGTDADGQWLVDSVEHELYQGKTTARLRRCIRSIY